MVPAEFSSSNPIPVRRTSQPPAPAYYNVDRTTGRSHEWIGYIKNTIAQVACEFTTNRMLTDYMNQFYVPRRPAPPR